MALRSSVVDPLALLVWLFCVLFLGGTYRQVITMGKILKLSVAIASLSCVSLVIVESIDPSA